LLLSTKQQEQSQNNWQAEQGLKQQEMGQQGQQFAQGLDLRKSEAATSAKREDAYANYLKSLTESREKTTNAGIAVKMKPPTEPENLTKLRAGLGDTRPWEEVGDSEWPMWSKVVENSTKPTRVGGGATTSPKLPPEYTAQKDTLDKAYDRIYSRIKENDRNRASLSKIAGNEDQIAVLAARNAKLTNTLNSVGKARLKLGSGKPLPPDEFSAYVGLTDDGIKATLPDDKYMEVARGLNPKVSDEDIIAEWRKRGRK
jgi:hypothetical protein